MYLIDRSQLYESLVKISTDIDRYRDNILVADAQILQCTAASRFRLPRQESRDAAPATAPPAHRRLQPFPNFLKKFECRLRNGVTHGPAIPLTLTRGE
jgi:hypothetical protein